MYIPKEFKTNRFKEVRIPSKGEYFNTGRFMQIPQTYGGEEPVKVNEPSKNELMAELEKEIESAEKTNE